MSGMMSKVKDALKSDHPSNEQDAYNTSSSGKHGQSSMPGAFDTGVGNTSSPRYTGTEGYGTAHSTDQRHVQGSDLGHDAAYQRATDPSNTTSKYASEPTQSSYTQSHGTSGITGGTHREAGYGTGAGAGTVGTGAGALGGHSHRKEVPDSNLMDPSDRERGSNIMDRSRADYTEDTSSGPNKLHKREDPRGNQDHSGLTRSDQDGVLRREQGSGVTGQTGYGDNTSGSRHDQTGGIGSTRQGGYGDTIGGSRYEDQPTSSSSEEPRHKSDIMNKLDPRVKTDTEREKYEDRDSGYSSKFPERDSDRHGAGHGGVTSGGAAAAAAAGTHSSRDNRDDRTGYGTHSSSNRDTHSGTHDTHKEHSTYGTHGAHGTHGNTDRSLPTRTRDEYGTGTTSAEHGNLAREHAQGGYSTQPSNTHDPRYGAAGSGPGTTVAGAAALGSDRHGHHDSPKARQGSQPVPYSMNAAHTQGHDPTTNVLHGIRSHFHCMGCGHKNDASHLKDHQGQPTSRSELHCMNCGHRNQVGHLLGRA